MPIVKLEPKSPEIEEKLNAIMEDIRRQVKLNICMESGFPERDVLVGLLRCPYRNPDPNAADVVVYIETNPHLDLEQRSTKLVEYIARTLIQSGLSVQIG